MSLELTVNIPELLREHLQGYTCVPVAVDLEDVLNAIEDDMATINFEDALTDRRLIAEVWNVQLVLAERPDLNDDQAWQVLQACEKHFEDLTTYLEALARQTADEMFPPAPRAKQAMLERLQSLAKQIESLTADTRTNPAAFGNVAARLDDLERELTKGGPS